MIRRHLFEANTAASLWRLVGSEVSADEWDESSRAALDCLGELPAAQMVNDPTDIPSLVLGEEQFGLDHWNLSGIRRLYYLRVRRTLPARIRPLLHRVARRRQEQQALLRWPIEDRYVNHQRAALHHLLSARGERSARHIGFWPDGRALGFAITHDVEGAAGLDFVLALADLETKYGFRSSFNFVPHDYDVPDSLLAELRARGFEIGVHGLRHDGTLFLSERHFRRQAPEINRYIERWGAKGFRAPFMHRHPEWLQELEISYDLSFFDTDPYEPVAGGTMSIWPFRIGRFVELPYTLAQDHTLMATLGEETPRIWFEKVDYLARNNGLALVNVHPDYMLDPAHFVIYERFLAGMAERQDTWHALPYAVAEWWAQRERAEAVLTPDGWSVPGLHGARVESIQLDGSPAPEAPPPRMRVGGTVAATMSVLGELSMLGGLGFI
ncbi:MAG: hypothetical protein ACKVUT_06805 [Gaiella sp.]